MLGKTIHGYKIDEKIAKTSTGIVYKVRDETLQVVRALKLFHPELVNNELIHERTIIAWHQWAKLDHASFINIYEAIDEDSSLGMIMDYVEGETLANIIKQKGRLGITQAVDYFLQIARGLLYAHQKGIFHRKICSNNIQISKDESIRILGLGALKTEDSKKVTPKNLCVGKVHYMAPEQFQGIYNIATEQYMLGILFYEMLTGTLPYKAKSIVELYKLHLTAQPVFPQKIVPEITSDLQRIVLRMISKRPENRFADLSEVIDAINEATDQIDDSADLSVQTLQYRAQQALEKRKIANAIYYFHKILSLYGSSYEQYKEIKKQFEYAERLAKEERDILKIREYIPEVLNAYDHEKKDIMNEYFNKIFIIMKQYPNSSRIRGLYMDIEREMKEEVTIAKTKFEEREKEIEKISKKILELLEEDNIEAAKDIFQPYKNSIHPIWQKIAYKIAQCERKVAHREYYCQGIKEFHNHNYLQAIINFKKVIDIDPDNKQIQNYLELAQRSQEQEIKKKNALEQYYKDGCQYFEQWKFPEALQQFKQVLELDPENEQAKKFATSIEKRLQDDNQIESISFFYQQGYSFFMEQKWREAIVCFQFVLNSMPDHKLAQQYKLEAENKLETTQLYNRVKEDALLFIRNEEYTQALERLNDLLNLRQDDKEILQYIKMCEDFLKKE